MCRNGTQAFNHHRMILLRAMREVETRNIHTGTHQAFELFFTLRSRSNRTDYFCTSHSSPLFGLSFCLSPSLNGIASCGAWPPDGEEGRFRIILRKFCTFL